MVAKVKQKMLKEKEKLIEMYHRRRMSLADIAEAYGCSRQYVQTIFVSLGIKRRGKKQASGVSPNRRENGLGFRLLEDKFIENNFRRMTDMELARYLDKPVGAVTYRRLIVLGKKKLERRNFTPKEDDYILDNYRRLTDRAMARKLNRPLISVTHHRTTVLNKLKRKAGRGTKAGNRQKNLKFEAISQGPADLPETGMAGRR